MTHYLCQGFKAICLEDLNVKRMLKNHKRALAISDMGFYELKLQLENKGALFGNYISVINQMFPSSKTGSNYVHQKDELKLSKRVYVCKAGSHKID